MIKVELVLLETEDEYIEEYKKAYLHDSYNLSDISVVFSKKDFDHIFYEPAKGDGDYKFSFRRAKRMYFMKAILSGAIETEIMFEPDKGTIALFCKALECVMYLRIRPGSGTLQVGTFFDFGENHSKMYRKQKRKCEPVTIEEIKKKME